MADYEARVGINFDVTQATASLQALQQQISAFQSALLKGSAASAKAAANLQRDLVNNINATGRFAASMTTVASSAENFTRALETNKLSLGQYFRYAGASTKTFGRFFKNEFDTINKVVRERVKTIQTQFVKMGRDANGALQAIKVRPLSLDLNDYATKAQLAAQRQAVFNQLIKQGSTNLLNFGKNTQWAGRQLMVGFTIPLALMGRVATREFEKIEKQAIRFKRVYGDAFSTDQETEEALKNVRGLADEFTRYGIEVEKTLELAANVAQMGLKSTDLLAQVTEATRLAVLGEVEQQEALQATISVTNAFGVAAEDLAEKINFLNAVENETVTAIQDLTIAIPKAGPVVKQLGGDVEDLAFFLTAMKEGGINASEGANALKSGLASLINPTDKAAQMLLGFGINLKEIVETNQGNVTGVVIDFAKALDTLDPLSRARAIEQLFGKFQFSRLSTLFQNVIKQGTQAERVLKLSQSTSEELAILAERELKRVEDSPLFKFRQALEKFQAALAPVGEEFLKAITPVIEFARGFLENFNNMSEGAKRFAVIATTVIAGIGPIALMTFGLIANGVANLIKMFALIGKVFTGFGQKTTNLGLQTNYLTQEQLESQAAAISMAQSHATLTQVLTSEAIALERLAAAYNLTTAAQQRAAARQGIKLPNTGGGPIKARTGMLSVPGPKGAGDIVPALLAPGEAVIPAKAASENRGLIRQLIDGDVRGFRFGLNPFASMMSRSRVGVSMPSSKFIEALRSRNLQYQSGFVTKTGADFQTSLGLANPAQAALRARMEQTLFNTPLSAGGAGRPTYGFAYSGGILNQLINILFAGKRGARFNAATRGRSSALSRYGDISLITNRGVGRRSTAFAGDTLLGYSRNPYFGRNQQGLAPMYGATPGQLKAAGFGAFNRQGGQTYPAGFGNALITNPKVPFIETQTPGGFSFKEIEKVIARDPILAKQLRAEMSAAGLGNIRVSGSGFVAKLFKRLGVPGYEFGTENAGSKQKRMRYSYPGKDSLEKQYLKEYVQRFGEAKGKQVFAAEQSIIKAEMEAARKILREKGLSQQQIMSALQVDRSHIVNVDKNIKDVRLWSTQLTQPETALRNNLILQKTRESAKNQKALFDALLRTRATEQDASKILKSINSGRSLSGPQWNLVGTALASIDRGLKLSPGAKGYVDPKSVTSVYANYAGAAAAGISARNKAFAALQKTNPALAALLVRDPASAQSLANKIMREQKGGVVKGTTGVGVPSSAKVIDGKPADTRLVATSKGETILTKKSTGILRRGLFSFIPGLGVLGRADGLPEGQKTVEQRVDKRGRPYFYVPGEGKVSAARAQQLGAMAPAQQQGPKPPGRFAAGAGSVGMVAGMAAMGYSMTGGPGSDIAGMAALPLMMLPALLPMLTNPIALAAVGIAGLAVAAFALNEQFKKNVKEAYELAMATGASSQSLEKLAEFGGNVTAGQIMDRRRSERDIFQVVQGKTGFGDAFLQSEAGKKLSAGFGRNLSVAGRTVAMEDLANQMAVAVASGALNPNQARDIVAALGKELDDYSLSIEVNSRLISLLGPNGENLLKDPLEIRMKMIESSRQQISGLVAGQISEAAANAEVNRRRSLGIATTQDTGKDFFGTFFDNFITNMGIVSTGGGSAISAISRSEEQRAALSEAQIGSFIAYSTIALQSQQEMVDSLQLEYETRIANAKAQGDLAKAAELEEEYIVSRNKLMLEGAKTFRAIKSDFTLIGNQDNVLSSISEQIKTLYKDDPLMSGIVGGLLEDIEKLDNEQELTLKLSLLSGDLSPTALANMFSSMPHSTTVELITKLGATSAVQASELARLFGDETVEVEVKRPRIGVTKTTQKASDQILQDITGMDPGAAQDFMAQFDPIIQALSAAGEQALASGLTFYYENPELLKDLNDDLVKFKETVGDKPITLEVIQEVYGQQLVDKIKENQEYFDSLPDEQKLIYTTVLRVLGEIDPAARQAAAINAVLGGGKAAEIFKKNTGLDYKTATSALGADTAAREAIKAADAAAAWQVTEASKPGPETKPTTPSGEKGKGTNPLDAIFDRLKRIRNASLGAKRDIQELIKLMKPGSATSTFFRGTDQKLLFAGYGTEFIDTVMGMDEKTRKSFVTIENGVVKVTEAGKALNNAFSEIALGDFQFSLASGVASVNKQIEAMNKLVAVGMSTQEALNIVQDEQLAYAIATRASTEEIQDFITWSKKLEASQLQLRLSTPEGRIGYLSEQFNEVQKFFTNEENVLRLQFEIDNASLVKSIEDAQAEIEKQQVILDDYQYALDLIAEQEDLINKKYDERQEALDKIYSINRDIAEQEKSQLDVAQALATGDIAAAARAMQQAQATRAEQAREAQQQALDRARETELSQVKQSFMVWDEGTKKQIQKTMTRKEIESEIEKISKSIAKIEEERLEPSQRLLTIEQQLLDARLDSLTFLGQTASQWSLIEANINKASTATDTFRNKIIAAFNAVKGFKIVQNPDGTFSVEVDTEPIIKEPGPASPEEPTKPGELVPPGPGWTWDDDRGGWKPPAKDTGTAVGPGGTLTEVPNANQARIDELNRLRRISREKFQNSEDAAYRARLMELNISRGEEIRRLGGIPLASGGMVAKRYGMGGKVGYYPMGGLIPYMASGGIFKSINTDTVPAMLTPGEFVMRRNAVNKYGVDTMKAINSGTYSGSSVYNYSLNVNVKSDANPEQIARAVMTQIKQVDSQRLRSNRY